MRSGGVIERPNTQLNGTKIVNGQERLKDNSELNNPAQRERQNYCNNRSEDQMILQKTVYNSSSDSKVANSFSHQVYFKNFFGSDPSKRSLKQTKGDNLPKLKVKTSLQNEGNGVYSSPMKRVKDQTLKTSIRLIFSPSKNPCRDNSLTRSVNLQDLNKPKDNSKENSAAGTCGSSKTVLNQNVDDGNGSENKLRGHMKAKTSLDMNHREVETSTSFRNTFFKKLNPLSQILLSGSDTLNPHMFQPIVTTPLQNTRSDQTQKGVSRFKMEQEIEKDKIKLRKQGLMTAYDHWIPDNMKSEHDHPGTEHLSHANTIYQQYIHRIKSKQLKLEVGERHDEQRGSIRKSSIQFDSPSRKGTNLLQNIFVKDKLSLNEENAGVAQSSSLISSVGHIMTAKDLQKLKFPASQKDLQVFSRAQEQNELRFVKGNDNLRKEERSEDHQQLTLHSHKISLKEAWKLNNQEAFKMKSMDSMRIQELIRERNEVFQSQENEQKLHCLEQEQLQAAQLEVLVQQSLRVVRKGMSPMRKSLSRKDKQTKSQIFVINDISEITKSRQFQQTRIVGGKPNESHNSILLRFTTDCFAQPVQSPNLSGTREATFKQIGNIIEETGQERQVHIANYKEEMRRKGEIIEHDLTQQTQLVDWLQQHKIHIREDLERFLNSRPRLQKMINRNCLMDLEQFMFFMMSFFQFCIDDMFWEYKQNNMQRLNVNEEQMKEVSAFKLSQKIPLDIMRSISEEIGNYLNQAINEDFNEKERVIDHNQILNFMSLDNEKHKFIEEGVNRFMRKFEINIERFILPQTLIDRMGGFARLRQLIVLSVKQFNNYINTASKLNLIEEDDDSLIDKHLMPAMCALVNEDQDTLTMQINILKIHKNVLSPYDFFTIKRIFWDMMGAIKLDSKLKFYMILKLENIRFELFDNPFSNRVKELGVSLMKSYELCNYFRNANPSENASFLGSLFQVMYRSASFSVFQANHVQKLKFTLNDRFFDYLQKFLLEELIDKDQKWLIDVKIRIMKLRIKSGVAFNFFSIIHEDSEAFFTSILPFLQSWVQKYNLSNTLMDSKAMDFKFLEIFLKLALHTNDLFSVFDSEPSLMHFVVNEAMLSFWIKGIIAYFEQQDNSKKHYKYIIDYLSQLLLLKKDDKQDSTPKADFFEQKTKKPL